MSNTTNTGHAPHYYTVKEAAALLRYDDTKAFLDAVHRDGIPHLRANARKLLFPATAFHAWLDRRTVGNTRAA
jgi:excisionase family DNA binding protein